MTDFDGNEVDPCIADNCYNDALFCSEDCAIEHNKDTFRQKLIETFWQMYYHMELENIAGIEGNDHPRLQKMADAFLRRYPGS